MAVNTDGTYQHVGPILTVDVDGTPFTIECAVTSAGIIAEENTVTHPRTGCTPPKDVPVDANYTLEVDFMHGYGTDGIYDLMEALEGTTVAWRYETGPDASEAFPVFDFSGPVPFLSPLPQTPISEYAADSFVVRCDDKPVKTVAPPIAVTASTKKAVKS